MATLETVDGVLYADDRKVVKGWESFSGWFWLATELVDGDDVPMPDGTAELDRIWYGLVQGREEEWGSWSELELWGSHDTGLVWQIRPQDLPYAGRRS